MAYKGFFFVREGRRQAPNDGNNNDSVPDDDEHHRDGQGIGGTHYHACRWHNPPHPTSTSLALPRTPTHPMAMHLPLFEWENMATDPVLPTDPAVTHHPLIIPTPALSIV
ncbi:hypothetical protein IW262DRAFT_1292287 [Armillaria fumosa]|nr:hypothetical protein IW262DRAFT_1292287 [Armillaria fumosa]